MPSREEEQERFRKKRLKKHGTIEVNDDQTSPTDVAGSLTFKRFFMLINGVEKSIIVVVASVFLSTIFYNVYPDRSTMLYYMLVSGPLILFPLLALIYFQSYYNSYKNFEAGALYSIDGWHRIVRSLDSDFWKGNTYANISIEIKPDPVTNPEERKRLFEFCSLFSQQGEKSLQSVSLNHFTLVMKLLVGKQSAFVVNKLVSEFPKVIKQNRPGLISVAFNYKGESKKAETTRDEDEESRATQMIDEMRRREDMERGE